MLKSLSFFLVFFSIQAIGQPYLKDKFQHAFKMGAALHEDIFFGKDDKTAEIVIRENNSITAENVMKAETLCPKENEYDFEKADGFVTFGEKHNMFMVGHTLVWHNQCPDWFFTDKEG